jgi:uncharacterized protein (DUF342 family)
MRAFISASSLITASFVSGAATEADGLAVVVVAGAAASAVEACASVVALEVEARLKVGGVRGDVRIEARAGGGDQIDGDKMARILLGQLVDGALDSIDKGFIRSRLAPATRGNPSREESTA